MRYRRRDTKTKQPDFSRIGDILQKALKKRKIPLDIGNPAVCDAWNQAVGPLISFQTCFDKLKNGILYIRVSNSVWLQQLQFMKQDIMEKINLTLGRKDIKDIFFSIGEITRRPLSKEKPPLRLDMSLLRERDRKIIEACTSSIKDSELSNLLKRVIAKEMIRKRTRESGFLRK
ncbi:MAG: DUF721 domain-containing protein [Syntrophales bacterium]